MKFNEKLIKLRKDKMMSQEELGEKLNVTRQTVSKWELGQTTPDMEKLVEMSKLFNVKVDELLNEEEENMSENFEKNNNVNVESVESEKNENNNENNKKNIAIIIGLVVVLIALIVAIVVGVVSNVRKRNQGIIDRVGNIFDKTLTMIEDGQDSIKESINNQKKENEENEKESKGLIDKVQGVIDQNIEAQKVDSFNQTFEMLKGTQPEIMVRKILDEASTVNKKGQGNIEVEFNGKITSDPNEIIELKGSLSQLKRYEVVLDYNELGYVNKITIMEIADANAETMENTVTDFINQVQSQINN